MSYAWSKSVEQVALTIIQDYSNSFPYMGLSDRHENHANYVS